MSHSRAASIIVPSRGGAQRLPVLLNALSRQNTTDFEVITVLDGDVDDSEGLLRRAYKTTPFRLRWIVFPENRGRSAALNAGFANAGGHVLIRSDDDLEPGPDFVAGHIERHHAARNGIVGLTMNRFPSTAYARVYGNKADALHRAEALAAPPHTHWRHWSANVSVTRDMHEQVGGYDERYRAYGWEDVDYGYRLHLAGIPVVIAPELMAVHHVASTTTAIRAARALHSGAARDTFLRIHGRDALPEQACNSGIWGRMVWAASILTTEKSIRAWSGVVDRAAEALPPPVAEKLIALAVESAGLAGVRYPERAKSRF
jgi:GT2 family glycosyltransferase